MKINNFDLIQIQNVLNENSNKKLPQKISFAITKNIIQLNDDFEIYQKSLQKIFSSYDNYIIKNEDGKPKVNKQGIPLVDKEHQEDFNKELMELLQTEINIELYQIEEDAFNYEDNDRYDALSAQDIYNLQKIICKQNDNKESKEDD